MWDPATFQLVTSMFPLIMFTHTAYQREPMCVLSVSALEYPNLDISETTRDYWVITGNI